MSIDVAVKSCTALFYFTQFIFYPCVLLTVLIIHCFIPLLFLTLACFIHTLLNRQKLSPERPQWDCWGTFEAIMFGPPDDNQRTLTFLWCGGQVDEASASFTYSTKTTRCHDLARRGSSGIFSQRHLMLNSLCSSSETSEWCDCGRSQSQRGHV